MEALVLRERVIGVDISNDATNLAIVDVRGNIIAKDCFPTNDYPDINHYVNKLVEVIITLSENNGGYDKIRSIGISCPSSNFMTGSIENAANLPWKGVIPLAAILRDQLGAAVAVGNDCHASALGERMFGCAHGLKDFLVVNLGIGLGSCYFSNGQEQHGAMGYAGEIGHTCLIDGGRPCGCGRKGCLEAYTAANGLVQNARDLMAESDAPSLMREQAELTPIIIEKLCEKGDALAIETYRRTGYLFGIGLANYASIINPEVIVVTGGISQAGHWLLEPAIESFESHVFPNLSGKVKIIRSRLDYRERDVLGASALAWEVPEYSLFK